jgi:hypothetical protein
MRPFSDLLTAVYPPYGARMATCPECEFDEIETAEYEEGDTLSCPECGKNLVLMGADDDDDDEDDKDDAEDEDKDDLDDDEEGVDEEEDVDE